MNIPISKKSNSVGGKNTKRFRVVFYQRLEQMVDVEAENEDAANEAAHLMLERGEINPIANWDKSEVDVDGVFEIKNDGTCR